MFHSGFYRAIAGPPIGIVVAAASLVALLSVPIASRAHEGHDHGPAEAGAGPVAPRVAAHSETFELVGVLRGDRLVIYLDRYATNEPITNADIAVTIGNADEAVNAEKGIDGTYSLTSTRFQKPGQIELVFSITGEAGQDLLAGTLTVPQPDDAAAAPGASRFGAVRNWLASAMSPAWRIGLFSAATLGLLLIGSYLARRRRFVPAAATTLVALVSLALLLDSAFGRGGDGSEVPAAKKAAGSVADAPRRLPDGHVFVPKPTQRLLDVRTEQLEEQSAQRGVSLIGRIIADPNRTSLVQSINGGRVMAPEKGLPRIGQAVKQGDLLAQIEPTVPQADRTTILEKLGEIEQMIAVAEAKINRIRILVEKQVTAKSQLVDAEAELEGLRRRREVLRSVRVEPEQLRAPTSGVIATARVVPGQVVQAQDVLFQIVDPASLWVEALVYGEADPASLSAATASAPGRDAMKLRLQGFSRTLQQHATIVQFAIEDPPSNLSVGLPVTVIARSGEPVTAMIVPKDAVVRSSNGEAIVWMHELAELFEPRPVRVTPFDAGRVIVDAGLSKGARVVIRAADLVNQVR